MSIEIMRKKSVEQSIADTTESDSKLRKQLGSLDLTVLGVAAVVGAGIFTLTASTAGDVAGPAVSLAFVIAAITCGLAALCYAELASTVPVAGSAYTFSYATFGEFIAWIIGWDLVLEFTVAAAVVSKAWSEYLATVLGLIGAGVASRVHLGPVTLDWGALLLAVVLTVLLTLGTKLSSRVSIVLTTIKVTIVLLVIVVGLFYINPANYSPFIPPAAGGTAANTGLQQSLISIIGGSTSSTYGIYGILAAGSLMFFAFLGFDAVATTAEEARNPQRSLPRGILGSLTIATVLYLGVAFVLTGMVSYTQLRTQPDGTQATLATAFTSLGVDWAATVISVGALLGLTTGVMVALLGTIRVVFAMSRDGLLPRGLARSSRGRGTPVRATILTGAVVAAATTFFPIGALEEMINIGTLFAFVLVSIGVVILRRVRPDLHRGFHTPLVPLVPTLSVLACLWLMINLSAETWLRFVGWMLIGLVVYALYGRTHSRLRLRQRHGANVVRVRP
jgi:APA family basic amino acid/polyamine antiporter